AKRRDIHRTQRFQGSYGAGPGLSLGEPRLGGFVFYYFNRYFVYALKKQRIRRHFLPAAKHCERTIPKMERLHSNNTGAQNAQQTVQSGDNTAIDLRSLFYRVLSHWYLFVLGVILAYTAAWLYLRYTKPSYEIRSTVMVKGSEEE